MIKYRACKLCGAVQLQWRATRGYKNRKVWRLYEVDGSMHICPHQQVRRDWKNRVG